LRRSLFPQGAALLFWSADNPTYDPYDAVFIK